MIASGVWRILLWMPFPADESLCERCGYPLRGVSASGACPECGLAVASSDPTRRSGLPWQNEPSAAAWLATTARVILQPRHAFDRLRVGGGGNWPDRVYLSIASVVSGVVLTVIFAYTTARILGAGRWFWLPTRWTPLAALIGVVVLTYVEALGVAFFSRRRGWAVAWPLAERVACYAAIGWLPAAVLLGALAASIQTGWHRPWLFHGQVQLWADEADMFLAVLVAGFSILWFETLVWLGVRRLRYANPAPAPK